jgi:hypothetical protein
MKKTIYVLLIISLSLIPAGFASAQEEMPSAELEGMLGNNVSGVKPKVNFEQKTAKVFAPKSMRNPFLSKEEVASIDKARDDEEAKNQAERQQAENAQRAKMQAEEKQRAYEEEIKRNPARAVMDKLSVDGILGNQAIINGEVRSVGAEVMGAKIVSVSENSVTFVYKGQRFVKKLPLI